MSAPQSRAARGGALNAPPSRVAPVAPIVTVSARYAGCAEDAPPCMVQSPIAACPPPPAPSGDPSPPGRKRRCGPCASSTTRGTPARAHSALILTTSEMTPW
eukprot:scaffold323415_cov35-Tisochrysis_lutea.AAC.3